MRKKLLRYSSLELNIFLMLQQLSRSLRNGTGNPLRLQALRLLEEGKPKEALLLLPLNEISAKTNTLVAKKTLQEESIKQEANEILQDGEARLYALGFATESEKRNAEIEKTYDSVLDVALIAKKHRILIEYADFLQDRKKTEKARKIVELIEKNLDTFDDLDIYTRYDTYNLLADLSATEDEKSLFEQKAKDSAIAYIRGLDDSDWETYLDACNRLSELYENGQEMIPLFMEAIRILELHPEVSYADLLLCDFCDAVGLLYQNVSNYESAEEYINRSAEIARQKTVDAESVFRAFAEKRSGNKTVDKIPLCEYNWQMRLVRAYKHLYSFNEENYRKEYVDQMLVVAVISFVNDDYKQFFHYLFEASHISGDSEEYKWLRDFTERCKKISNQS